MRLVLPLLLVACGPGSKVLECSDIDVDALAPYADCSVVIEVESTADGPSTTERVYDGNGQLVRFFTRQDGEVTASAEYTYDEHLQPLTMDSQHGLHRDFVYNAIGLLVNRTTTVPDGPTDVYEAEASESRCEVPRWAHSTDGEVFREQLNTYDDRSRLVRVRRSDSEPARPEYSEYEFSYDGDDEGFSGTLARIWETSAPDGEPGLTWVGRTIRDTEGRILDHFYYLGAEVVEDDPWIHDHYEYDADGNQTLYVRQRTGVEDEREATTWRDGRRAYVVKSELGEQTEERTYTWSCP